MNTTTSFAAAALCVTFAAAHPALAEPTAEDKGTARTLFDSAQKLMLNANYEQACPMLASSLKLDPKKGVMLNYALCLEHLGKLASAWTYWREGGALARAAGDPRADEADRHVKAIEPKLAKLRIDVPPAARIPGLEVRRDSTLLDASVWGVEAPMDPGEHVVEVAAPQRKTAVQKVVITSVPGAVAVVVPILDAASAGPLAPTAGDAVPGDATAKPSFWNGRRVAGAAVAGVGVVGVAVGAAFGAVAGSKNSASLAQCRPNEPTQCNPQGIGLRNDAFTASYVSSVALAVGGAAIVGGVIAIAIPTAPPNASSTALRLDVRPAVGLSSGGLALIGVW